MYLRPSGAYYVGTEQRSRRAPFLILFSWNDYKALDEIRASCADCIGLISAYDRAIAGVRDINDPAPEAIEAYKLACTIGRGHCEAHTGIRSGVAKELYTYPNGKPKLWATVRSVALQQCGHFMMGCARIGGASISISGSCGSDGLPRDYQEVPKAYRDRLVEVPEAVAAVYWSDNGHNTIGSAAPTMRDWALEAFALTLEVRRRRSWIR